MKRKQPELDMLAAFQIVHVLDRPGASAWLQKHALDAFIADLEPASLRAALASPQDRDLVHAAVAHLVSTQRLPGDWLELADNYIAEQEQ